MFPLVVSQFGALSPSLRAYIRGLHAAAGGDEHLQEAHSSIYVDMSGQGKGHTSRTEGLADDLEDHSEIADTRENRHRGTWGEDGRRDMYNKHWRYSGVPALLRDRETNKHKQKIPITALRTGIYF